MDSLGLIGVGAAAVLLVEDDGTAGAGRVGSGAVSFLPVVAALAVLAALAAVVSSSGTCNFTNVSGK